MQKFIAYWLFYGLGIAFWLLNRNTLDTTILCVFYAVFTGTVWGMISRYSVSTEPATWRHYLPPFLLNAFMMFSVKMRMLNSSEVVLFTAMSLIHLRAAIFSYSRLPVVSRSFIGLQMAGFAYGLVFLFQKTLLPFEISRSFFIMSTMVFASFSVLVLLVLRRKFHGQIPVQAHDDTIGT